MKNRKVHATLKVITFLSIRVDRSGTSVSSAPPLFDPQNANDESRRKEKGRSNGKHEKCKESIWGHGGGTLDLVAEGKGISECFNALPGLP